MQTAGIYIHIPFCITKCIYCDFYSVAGQDDRIDNFVNALIAEIKNSDIDVSKWKFDTIFIGGGTPSVLSPNQLEKVISTLDKRIGLNNKIEFTLEANPGEAPLGKLRDFRTLGINRLSIGIQSFNLKLLKFLSRIHTSNDAVNTFNSARKAGFDNINCDLIYNVPDQTVNDWKNDLNKLVELGPEHISAYSLTVENGTVLNDLVNNKTVKIPDDEMQIDFYNTATEILSRNNYQQYEISNFSKAGKECLHNLHYWNHDKYIGFGPSAHSFDGLKRWNNYSNLEQYILFIENDKSPIESYDHISENDRINEIVGFGLRMIDGVELNKIPNNRIIGLRDRVQKIRNKYPDMIIMDNSNLRLNQRGLQFADAIAVELMI